jgi:hypothetical protein
LSSVEHCRERAIITERTILTKITTDDETQKRVPARAFCNIRFISLERERVTGRVSWYY